MYTFQVCSLDVWGNVKDGFEVNNIFPSGKIEVISVDDKEIVKVLKEFGYIRKGIHCKSISIDGDDELIFIDEAKTGKPVYQLRKI